MARFSSIIWETRGAEPREILSDMHWVHLSTAWFTIVDQHVVQPALAQHDVVILDSWYHKLIARFRVKQGVAFREMQRCFAHLTVPDFTCFLDVDPTIAATRKTSFGYSESGNLDGLSGATRENFVTYQGWVRRELETLGRDNGWFRISIDDMNPTEAAAAAIDVWLTKFDVALRDCPENELRNRLIEGRTQLAPRPKHPRIEQ